MLNLPRSIQIRAWLEAGPLAKFCLFDSKLDINSQARQVEQEYRNRLITAAAFTSYASNGLLNKAALAERAEQLLMVGNPIGVDMLAQLTSIETSRRTPMLRTERVQYVFDDVQRLRYLYDYQHQAQGRYDPRNIFPWSNNVLSKDMQRLELELLREIFSRSRSQLCRRIHDQFLKRLDQFESTNRPKRAARFEEPGGESCSRRGVKSNNVSCRRVLPTSRGTVTRNCCQRSRKWLPPEPLQQTMTVVAQVLPPVCIS